MIVTLTRMRLAVWRRTPNDLRGVGITLGVALAGWVVWAASSARAGEGETGDLLAVTFAVWMVAWMFGPVQSGGGDVLRPGWFTLLPVVPRRLARDILIASFVGVGAAITVAASLALAAHGAGRGVAAAAVGAVVGLLQTALMVATSKLVAEYLGAAARSRVATELAGAQWGLFIAAMTAGWILLPRLIEAARGAEGAAAGLPAGAAMAVRVLPSGWGVVAVEAAGRGDATLSLVAVIGLACATWGGFRLWSRLLVRRTTGGTTGSSNPARGRRGWGPSGTPLDAVVGKDLRTWWRDPRRGIEIRSTLWAGMFTSVFMWVVVPDALAFSGAFVALIGAMACVNVYAMDGTALWHTLLTPGAARVDVRGRQVSWLLVFAPATVLASALGLVVSRATWTVPWVLALLPALLGAAVGLLPLLSVVWVVPEIDAHRRGGNPFESGGDATGLHFAMLAATVLAVAPTGAVLAIGAVNDAPVVTWSAVGVGVASGLVLARGLGRIAWKRLERRGPELLQLMRVGPRARTSAPRGAARGLSTGRSWAVGVLWTLAMICLVPQGLVAMAFRVLGVDVQAWFVALYLPLVWQYPVAIGFAAVGVAAGWGAWNIQRDRRPSTSDEPRS